MQNFPLVRQQLLAGGVIPFAFLSEEIDFLTEGEYGFPLWPSLPDFKAVDLQIRGIWTALQATAVSAMGALSMGNNDPGLDNMLPSTDKLPTDASGATAILTPGGGPFLGAASAVAVLDKMPDLTTPPRVLVIDPITGTGVTQAKFRLLVQGVVAKLPTITLG
jgi:hypothetical protein